MAKPPKANLIVYSAGINACGKAVSGWRRAMCFFNEVQRKSLEANTITSSATISACEKANVGEVKDEKMKGESCHIWQMVNCGFVVLGNSFNRKNRISKLSWFNHPVIPYLYLFMSCAHVLIVMLRSSGVALYFAATWVDGPHRCDELQCCVECWQWTETRLYRCFKIFFLIFTREVTENGGVSLGGASILIF